MNTFDDYAIAADTARHDAARFNAELLVRRVNEYGKTRFVVSFACRSDADYLRSEIVRPGDPCATNCLVCTA